MRILLVEDDKKKADDIKLFLLQSLDNVTVTVKESYQSGIRELLKGIHDLLLLDMSIPTWDRSVDERGGNFEKFGGYKILKESKRKGIIIQTILVSMFDDFSSNESTITLKDIDIGLRNEFNPFYIGHVYYNASEENWKEMLSLLINNVKQEEE